jgi:hypothetical protein
VPGRVAVDGPHVIAIHITCLNGHYFILGDLWIGCSELHFDLVNKSFYGIVGGVSAIHCFNLFWVGWRGKPDGGNILERFHISDLQLSDEDRGILAKIRPLICGAKSHNLFKPSVAPLSCSVVLNGALTVNRLSSGLIYQM